MNFLNTIFAFAFALGILIIVHEFGHYLVARFCNVKVLRFSIGFGRVLWNRRSGADQTEWAISAVPLGGYVKMLDEREGPVAEAELGRAFNRQTVYRRFVIVMAGPVANFLLAIFLYWLLFMHGMPGLKPVVGATVPDSAAAHAGFLPGEIITAVDGDSVATWQDARWVFLQHAVNHQSIPIEVRDLRGNTQSHMLDTSTLESAQLEGDFLSGLGFVTQPTTTPAVIGGLTPHGAAAQAGLQIGDEIVKANGRAIKNWDDLVKMIRENPKMPILLDIMRGDTTLADIRLVPDAEQDSGKTIGRAGIVNPYFVEVSYAPLPALRSAATRTWELSLFSLRMLGKMITGEISLKNLSGPITIADYAGQSAQVGWVAYLTFIALISISLGVLNLLPIPLLDGGHLMYYMFEIIKGSPVSDHVVEIGQRIGMGVLLLLMACALYNDITRLITS